MSNFQDLLGNSQGTLTMSVVERLKCFLESEARSCSMDFGCVTSLYVYRMWGGNVAINEIEAGLKELRKQGYGCY